MLGFNNMGGGFAEAAGGAAGTLGSEDVAAQASMLNVKISMSKIIKRRGSFASASGHRPQVA
jgi:hypothetical protein